MAIVDCGDLMRSQQIPASSCHHLKNTNFNLLSVSDSHSSQSSRRRRQSVLIYSLMHLSEYEIHISYRTPRTRLVFGASEALFR